MRRASSIVDKARINKGGEWGPKPPLDLDVAGDQRSCGVLVVLDDERLVAVDLAQELPETFSHS